MGLTVALYHLEQVVYKPRRFPALVCTHLLVYDVVLNDSFVRARIYYYLSYW